MKVDRIAVLGSGQMGRGIAQTAAQAGFEVLLSDQSPELAAKAVDAIGGQLKRLVEKGKIAADAAETTLRRITAVKGLEHFEKAGLVVEAVIESPDLKYEIFSRLDRTLPPEVLLASNTSSVSITRIAASTKRPDKVAGMHFMNPVPVMKLVEGIRGLQTSDETFRTIRGVAEKMGKTFVEVQDQPGFAVNRILMPMINEAITALHEGVASAADIDAAMKLGTNQPMGPIELADFIGLDTCLAIMEVLHRELGDSKYRPNPLLRKYVAAGWLGRKTGRGFYTHA